MLAVQVRATSAFTRFSTGMAVGHQAIMYQICWILMRLLDHLWLILQLQLSLGELPWICQTSESLDGSYVILAFCSSCLELIDLGDGLWDRCSISQTGDLTKSDRAVDGIFGFGQQDMSVISQLSSQGITPKVFSHCLKGDGGGGGILVLGEIVEEDIVYSPLVPSQ